MISTRAAVRRPLLVVLAALALTLPLAPARVPGSPAIARAGGYDVFACDSNYAGGVSPSWSLSADPGFTAYFACPASNDTHGIIARSVWQDASSRAGFLQGAFAIFDAPPGTTVEA